jgi:hypothetical protein
VKFHAPIVATCLLTCAALAQQALTNDAVVKMVKGGLNDTVIVQMIQSQPGSYTVTPDSMMSLKTGGVSDQVLEAMAAKSSSGSGGAALVQPSTTASTNYDDLDTGIYHKVKGEWVAVPTEAVNWQTGGVLKSIASNGIVKGDVNGHLKGGNSQTVVNSPLELLIKAPDNMEATDFQLVHFHDKSNQREFRTMTGGVFHASGGASRDAVAFVERKIAKHTYLVTLTNVTTPGEYGFLSPGLSNSTASGSTGKAYTFHFAE